MVNVYFYAKMMQKECFGAIYCTKVIMLDADTFLS